MLALAKTGSPEGLWLRAERQTAGRGRTGRGWESPQGNLYTSTIVRLQDGDPPAATLALVAAIAVEETLRAYAPQCPFQIKWPNDILCDGAKLSGILLERSDDAVIIGIGVNLGFYPVGLDRPVTSLAALGNDPPAAGFFLEDMAACFARWLSRWRGEGLAPIRNAWLMHAHPAGTALSAKLPDGSAIDGLFDGLETDGALRLRLAEGGFRVIHAGDVFLI
jgi:BirA family transcriptional regulator, biotin operon repressor / biotin---[acetyl-CoA-carboxylase] ligase